MSCGKKNRRPPNNPYTIASMTSKDPSMSAGC
eukprot:CAMPEP_0113874970 /NCGR_PEP_ID=MMETSP0780_2-20120614/4656_1 /TAXON_ID=652834 /ORGANISM="Palpitomonas bilix" /LENGTH=31 /DNA_ID=CAMNT_0000860855 /DNA_START=423 /DNA_END=515 /DNA_ORIENTATION=+ /assembly_acc=CAM_ASM_000599